MTVSRPIVDPAAAVFDWRWRVLALVYRLRWLFRFLRATGSFIILIAIWLIISTYGDLPEYFLPAPSLVISTFGELMTKGILPVFVGDSMMHLLSGSLVSMVIAIPMGLAIGLSRRVANFFYPLFNFFQSLSGIAWIPLFIVWFGFNEKTIIAAINYTVVFPVVFNTLVGVRTIPPTYKNAVLTLGGGRLRVIRDVIIPGALPNIVTGIRLGIAYGWRAMIGAEMLIAANGLGYMIFSAQTFHLTQRIMLGMIIIGLLWMFLDQFVLRPLEAVTVQRWGMVQR